MAILAISSQRPNPNNTENAPIPMNAVSERIAFPAGSLAEKTPMRMLPARKEITIAKKHPVTGTVHPYEIRARHFGQLAAPQVASVRQ